MSSFIGVKGAKYLLTRGIWGVQFPWIQMLNPVPYGFLEFFIQWFNYNYN